MINKINKKNTLFKLFAGKNVSFFPIYLLDLSAVLAIKKVLGKACARVVSIYKGTDIEMYADKKSWNEISNLAQQKLMKDDSFYKKIKSQMIKKCAYLELFSRSLQKLKPEELNNRQLLKIYSDFEKLTLDLRAYAWMPNLVDMGSQSVFEIVEKEIIKQIDADENVKEYISKMTTPTEKTKQRESELNLYKIQDYIKKNKINNWESDKNANQLIANHLKKYGWLAYYYIGPAWNMHDIKGILKNNIKVIKEPGVKIKEIRNYGKSIVSEKKKIAQKLNLDKKTLLLLDKIGSMIFLKAYRKEFLIYSNYCFESILKEISRRLDLNLSEIRFATKDEIKRYLENPKLFCAKEKAIIRARLMQGCVSVACGVNVKIYSLEKGKIFLKNIDEEKKSFGREGLIKGNCAYPGKAKGIAKIINVKEEIDKLEPGEIMVSRSTNPDLIIAMQNAAAFVTNEGGITCHAAIVAREMKKPCIIGTKIATDAIQDGDLLEVDAGKGTVKILKKQVKPNGVFAKF